MEKKVNDITVNVFSAHFLSYKNDNSGHCNRVIIPHKYNGIADLFLFRPYILFGGRRSNKSPFLLFNITHEVCITFTARRQKSGMSYFLSW